MEEGKQVWMLLTLDILVVLFPRSFGRRLMLEGGHEAHHETIWSVDLPWTTGWSGSMMDLTTSLRIVLLGHEKKP